MLHLIILSLAVPYLSATPLSFVLDNTNLADNSALTNNFEIADCKDNPHPLDETPQSFDEPNSINQDLSLVPRDNQSCRPKIELLIPKIKKMFQKAFSALGIFSPSQGDPSKTKLDDLTVCEPTMPIPLTCAGPEFWYEKALGWVVDCIPGMSFFLMLVVLYCARFFFFFFDMFFRNSSLDTASQKSPKEV